MSNERRVRQPGVIDERLELRTSVSFVIIGELLKKLNFFLTLSETGSTSHGQVWLIID